MKHPQIPKRIYTNEVKPFIGSLKITDVNAMDIRAILNRVSQSGRLSTANKTLVHCKQLFNHACKLDLRDGNPASSFSTDDAGGKEKSRERALSLEEVRKVFQVLKENSQIFTRDNYLAVALLISLGTRKGELIGAKWTEFDFEKQLWHLPAERVKTGVAITIPLPDLVIPWFDELRVRACGSDFLFPSRRASERREYISDDTLNHALAKLFGQKVDGDKIPYDNLLGNAGIEHFVIHDLRRTCRTLLSKLGTDTDVGERCLNHKLKGVHGIYNRHDYLDKRRKALGKLSHLLNPIING